MVHPNTTNTSVANNSPQVLKEIDQGLKYLRAREFDKAEANYIQALKIDPKNVLALQAMGIIYKMKGDFNQALGYFEKNVAHNKEFPQANLDLATLLLERADTNIQIFNRALELLKHVLKLEPSNEAALIKVVRLLMRDGKYPEAQNYLEQAIKINPNSFLAHNNLGILHMNLGEFDKSLQAFNKALEINPNHSTAYYNISLYRKFEADDQYINAMLKMLEQDDLSDQDIIHLGFALAKAYDQLKGYDKSFYYLKMANQTVFKSLTYDLSQEERQYATLQKVLNKESYKSDIACFYQEYESTSQVPPALEQKINEQNLPIPIFILGMPRSGSTLVEQILSSHPQVFGAGEAYYFPQNIGDIVVDTDLGLKLSPEELANRSIRYLQLLQQHIPKANQDQSNIFVCDKMPSNFVTLGLIKLMLPHAKIIHTTRNPIATCLSCYQSFFSSDQPYIFDLDTLANFYKLYQQHMQHWHHVFDDSINPILDIQYEDLIADPETKIRELLGFCGLEWNNNCLNFHQNSRVIATASYNQARKPIYTSSLEKWKNYEEHLQPLIKILDQ